MFNNLTKEVILYSLIPAFIVALISLVLIIISKKNSKNFYKYDYIIKVLIIIIVGLVLPVITGYSVWVYERLSSLNTISSSILYLVLLASLIIALVSLLIIACQRLFQDLDNKVKEE